MLTVFLSLFAIIIRNGKMVWKHGPYLAEFQLLTWNFGGGPSDFVLTFFKMASAYGNFLGAIALSFLRPIEKVEKVGC